MDDAQAGLIPGKHIGDNILLATELIKGYTHKFITPRCMLKVDLKKAYDSLEWSFLQTVMAKLGLWGVCPLFPSPSLLMVSQLLLFLLRKGLDKGIQCLLFYLPLEWSICLDACMSWS